MARKSTAKRRRPDTPEAELVARVVAVAADPAQQARRAALLAATRAIGDGGLSHLQWVVAFATSDPANWHPAVREAHGDALLALIGWRVVPQLVTGLEPFPAAMPSAEVEEIHRDLSALLRDAVTSALGEVGPVVSSEGLSTGLIRLTEVGAKPAVWGRVYRSASVRVGVLNAAKDLILTAGERLIACRFCHAPLVAFRKQEFCTAACAQTSRNDQKARNARNETGR